MATELQRKWIRQKRRARPQENAELNVTAMLDMAFQLLAFFILTFEPSPVESLISLRMPTESATAESVGTTDPTLTEVPTSLPLPVSVYATPEGEIDRVVIGDREFSITSPSQLQASVASELANKIKEAGFDALKLQIQENLQFGPLMQVVDVCMRQRLPDGEPLTRINFVPLP